MAINRTLALVFDLDPSPCGSQLGAISNIIEVPTLNIIGAIKLILRPSRTIPQMSAHPIHPVPIIKLSLVVAITVKILAKSSTG